MKLVLTEHRKPPGTNRLAWAPFADAEGFDSNWWRPDLLGHNDWYVSAAQGGVEVARVMMDESADIYAYEGVPQLGDALLEIQFIEVAADHRQQGVGTELVRRLAEDRPERRLVAFSEGADRFWSGLGWERYDHPEGPRFYRPLFIQPEGWPK